MKFCCNKTSEIWHPVRGMSNVLFCIMRELNNKSKNNLNTTVFRVNITHTKQVYACLGTPIIPSVNAINSLPSPCTARGEERNSGQNAYQLRLSVFQEQ